MKDEKLVSIIVPVYKAEDFIGQCLNSLKAQTYRNIEVILIDDGSPDKSGEICDKYAEIDNRFIVIHQENAGVCAARNTGLAAAKGEYFGFVDPDDWVAPDMFEYLVGKLEEYGADIVSCPYYRVIPKKDTVSRTDGLDYVYTAQEAVEQLVNKFILRNIFWNKLFKRELFDGISFPINRIYEGTVLVYQLFEKANKIVQLGEPKYYYRDNPISYINTVTLKNSMDYVVAHINRFNDLKDRYPKIRSKLLTDTVKGILKLSYVGYRSTQAEIDAVCEDLDLMKSFIDENIEEIKTVFPYKSIQKEIGALKLCTLKDFKKAHKIRAFRNRKNKIFEGLLGRKFRMKPKKKNYGRIAPAFDEVQNDKLERLHNAEITVLDEIDRICRKNGLKYYLYGGTLLGAIRHKGFIPWDDDMDLVMFRRDYEKFAKACEKDLDEKFFYQTCFTDPEFPMLFAKIRMNDTYICEKKWENRNLHSGIYVDILPLDRFPKGVLLKKFFLHYMSLLHQVCAFSKPHTVNPIGVIYFKIHKKFSPQFNYKLRDRVLKFCNFIGSRKLVCSFGSHYQPMEKRILKADWFEGEEKKMQFGEKEYTVPSHWEGYIHHLFGESYMELPPEEERVCHADVESIVLCEEDKKLNETRRLERLMCLDSGNNEEDDLEDDSDSDDGDDF